MSAYSFLPSSFLSKTSAVNKKPSFMDFRGTGSNNINDIYSTSVSPNLPTNLIDGKIRLDFNELPDDKSAGFNWSGLADTKGLGGMVLGGLNTGANLFNTWMGAKNQKFMQDYYGEQMALQKADFANNASNTNRSLQERETARLNNRGIGADSEQGKQALADYMNKWSVKGSI